MTPQIIQAAGGIGAALPMLMMCWVAREVVPERWTSARAAILEAAPEDFIEFYLEHGEAIADYIHDKPESKARLKPLFERLADIGDSLGKAA